MIFDHMNLPSRTRPYPVKELNVQPFRPKQLGLLSKAVMLDDYGPAIEAMGESLTNLDVMDLTTGDFFYLLTWQRLNSLKRNPVKANWVCPGAVFHVEGTDEILNPRDVQTMVANWEEADEEARKELRDPDKVHLDGEQCDHQNYATITMDDFQVMYLDTDIILPESLDYPRCRTLAELVTLQRDPDVGMFAEAAQWIKHPGSLNERINMLMEQDTTTLYEEACEANRDVKHGILRTFTKACDKCGHNHPLSFTVDPRTFFL